MATDSVGQVIGGKYRLISLLAQGGMGVTYRAWDLNANYPVVLKMPRRPVDDADGSKAAILADRFVREIESMRALAHDHIVPIVDSGDEDGLPYVVMRFLPGGSLADHRKVDDAGKVQPMPAGVMHIWLPAIAQALDFIHSQGVVHRDVKPANIFFDGFRSPFLGDFGIAKVFDTAAGIEKGETLTGTQFAIGTPEYMAPETLVPQASIDGLADQYALAISVYEMLAGERPFKGEHFNIVVEHATMPPPPLDCRRLSLPASAAAAVARGLAKSPKQRFPNCQAFAKAVLADVAIQPVTTQIVRLLCPNCHKILRVPNTAGGLTGNCPSCRCTLAIANDFSALWRSSEQGYVSAKELPQPAPLPVLTSEKNSNTNTRIIRSRRRKNPSRTQLFGHSLITAFPVLMAALSSAVATHFVWSVFHTRQVAILEAANEAELSSAGARLPDTSERGHILSLPVLAKDVETEKARTEKTAAMEISAAKDALEATEKLSAIIAARRDQLARDNIRESTLRNSVGIELKKIPSSELLSNTAERQADPISSFYISSYEVTNAQWEAVMGSVPSTWKGDSLPVHDVSWYEAREYCQQLSSRPSEKRAGHVYRLPTEAEWEYACRAGGTTRFCFGDDARSLDDFAWHSGHVGKAQLVGLKTPNKWGLYDVHGNVAEWCDGYADDSDRLQKSTPEGFVPVLRGGCWTWLATQCTSSYRLPTAVGGVRDERYGFRIAMSKKGVAPDITTIEVLEEQSQNKPADLVAKSLDDSTTRPLPSVAELPALTTNSIGMTFVLIPSGAFLMGSVLGDRNETPVHEVTIAEPFYMGIHEATNANGVAVNGSVPSRWKDDNLPLESVTWDEATAFCVALSSLPAERAAGRVYRLPTEAEWEYACRAGTTSVYSFGDDSSLLANFAWFSDNSDGQTHPVGQKQPNLWGLYDMQGNVYEWCSDWFGTYPSGPVTDPKGPKTGTGWVLRGGGWHTAAQYSRSAFRFNGRPPIRLDYVGFRVVMSLPETSALEVAE